MHTHSDFPDDLSELERRLSAWQPSSEGLDADAMLFAAGRAAGPPHRVRFVWPALTGFLAVLALAFGVWATTERAERLALDQRLRQLSAAPSEPVSSPSVPDDPPRTDEPTADAWLTARRALEDGLEAWPPRPIDTPATADPIITVPVLMVGQRDALLDP
jgi:hypothetical protein